MNRLYWLNANGDWELVLESASDKYIMTYAEQLAMGMGQGIVGYAKYPEANVFMRWTMYRRHEGGISRAPRSTESVPKAIQLLEMLQ